MRRLFQLRLVDLLIAIVLAPPAAILGVQAVGYLLQRMHGREPDFEIVTLDHVIDCDAGGLSRQPLSERENLRRVTELIAGYEAQLAAGEIDVIQHPDVPEFLDRKRREIERRELKLAAEDFLRQPRFSEVQESGEMAGSSGASPPALER